MNGYAKAAINRVLTEGDRVTLPRIGADWVEAVFVRLLDDDTVLVRVREHETRVARTACWSYFQKKWGIATFTRP